MCSLDKMQIVRPVRKAGNTLAIWIFSSLTTCDKREMFLEFELFFLFFLEHKWPSCVFFIPCFNLSGMYENKNSSIRDKRNVSRRVKRNATGSEGWIHLSGQKVHIEVTHSLAE